MNSLWTSNVMTCPAATFQTGHQLVNTGLLSWDLSKKESPRGDIKSPLGSGAVWITVGKSCCMFAVTCLCPLNLLHSLPVSPAKKQADQTIWQLIGAPGQIIDQWQKTMPSINWKDGVACCHDLWCWCRGCLVSGLQPGASSSLDIWSAGSC